MREIFILTGEKSVTDTPVAPTRLHQEIKVVKFIV